MDMKALKNAVISMEYIRFLNSPFFSCVFLPTRKHYLIGTPILNFNILLGFQKNKHFLGYEDFVDIIWGGVITKLDYN